jgi:hypothetical protein
VSQASKPKERKSYGLAQKNLHMDFFCMRSKEESLEMVQPWRENFRERWSILEHIWSSKIKSLVFNLEE